MQKPDISAYFTEIDIHDEKHVGAAGGAAIIFTLLLCLGHALNTWFLFKGAINFQTAAIFHVLLVFVTAILARAFAGNGRDGRFFLLLLMSTATVGIFGAAGMLLTLLLHHWYMRFAQPFTEWFSTIFPSMESSDSQRIYDDIMVGRDEASKPYSVIPFMDVIWYGNEAQKRTALSKMTSRFHPNFAQGFKKALNDSSNTIRVQAATAISKIENQFVSNLMRMNQLLDERPKDPDVRLALAEFYDDYAFTGILDADRERNNREQALVHYMAYLEMKPTDQKVHVNIGRLLMRNGEADRAADWLKRSMELGHRDASLLLWYAEALYASHRYKELRLLSFESKVQAESMQPALAEALGFWTHTTGVRA